MNKIKYLLLILCLFVTTSVYAEESATTQVITSTTRPTTSSYTKSSTSRQSTSKSSYSYNESSSSTTTTGKSSSIKIKEVEGTSYKLFIDDKMDLLTETEEELLFSDMEKLAPYGNIGFVSISNSGKDDVIAKNYYVANFGETIGLLFMINMGTRQLTLNSFAPANQALLLKHDKENSISANVYRYATNKEYYTCAKIAFNQSYSVITGKAIFEPMKIASNAILAFAISSFILYIYVLNSSSIKKASNKEVMKGINRDVNITDIVIRPNGTRRVYSPQSSSSSGGGGGHSGGGGGGGFHSSSGGHGF